MRIGIVGLGLIGGSLGQALGRAGYDVAGCDVDPSVEERALDCGAVRRISTLEELAHLSDVVILCMPPEATVRAVSEVAPLMKPEAILTDVGSVKRPVVEAMSQLDGGPRAIAGHPMAGKAKGGIDNADPDLFRDRSYAMVSTDRTDEDTVDTLRTLIEAIGAKPVWLGSNAEAHDAAVALSSHLPQVLSSTLALTAGRLEQTGANPELRSLRGPGFESMTRLAASDPRMWAEILSANADLVLPALRAFQDDLSDFAQAIESRAATEIVALMARCQDSKA